MSVRNEYGKLHSILLCKPEHFVLQPINVIAEEFIRQGALPRREKLLGEHQEFAQAFVDAGVEVLWAEPDPHMPFQVFTRDIGVTTPFGVLLGTFREAVRQGEEARAEAALEGHVPVWRRIEAAPGIAFEGGDYMYVDEGRVALGIGARTTQGGAERIRALEDELGIEVIPVRFEPRFLHLDMIFNVVGHRVCVICPDALPDDFLRQVERWRFETIEVPQEGVFRLNCNLVALDEGVVLSPARNKEVNTQLKALGFEVIEVGLDDLLKGGGGPHCMGFPIKRE